jgi:hypothetical protein
VLYVEGDLEATYELKRRLFIPLRNEEEKVDDEEDVGVGNQADGLASVSKQERNLKVQTLLDKLCRRLIKDLQKCCDVTDYEAEHLGEGEAGSEPGEHRKQMSAASTPPSHSKGSLNYSGKQVGPMIHCSIEIIEWAAYHETLEVWEEIEGKEGDGGQAAAAYVPLVRQLRLVHLALRNNAWVRSTCCKQYTSKLGGMSEAQGKPSLSMKTLQAIKRLFHLSSNSSKFVEWSLSHGSLLHKGLDETLRGFGSSAASQVLVCLFAVLRELLQFSTSVKEIWQWLVQACESENEEEGEKREGSSSSLKSLHWKLLSLGEVDAVCSSVPVLEPESVFSLSGVLGGIICDGCSKWPFNNGFCFMTQIFMDKFGNDLQYKPRLFTFLTADGQGIEGVFGGPFLTIALHTGRTGGSEVVHFKHAFRPRVWYTIAIQVSRSKLGFKAGDSKLALWVNGSLMDTHQVEYLKIHKPLGAFCIGTRPPAIRGNHSFLSNAEDTQSFNVKGLMGPIHVYHHPLSDSYLKKMVGSEVSCLPNYVLRISNSQGLAIGRRRSFSGDTKGLFSNLLALYHPLLVKDSVCPNAVGIDFHTLSDYRQNQGHLSASVTVFYRGLLRPSLSACGQRLSRVLISTINDRSFSGKSSRSEDDVAMLGIASRSLSILASSVVPSSASEENLDTDIPLVIAGSIHLILERLTTIGEDTTRVITSFLSSLSDFMEKSNTWRNFCKYLLFNRRIWKKVPASCKIHLLYIIGRYCELAPAVMFEVGVIQALFTYISECTYEHKRQIVSEDEFNSMFTSVKQCMAALLLKCGSVEVGEIIKSSVAYMSTFNSALELEHFILLFEEVFSDSDAERRKEISKLLVQEKFVEITLSVLTICEEKFSQHFCEVIMNHMILLFSKLFESTQGEAELQFAESYYAMSDLLNRVIFSRETSAYIGKTEYISILCSSLTNMANSQMNSNAREQVLSGTCTLKSMIFMSPFVLGLHRLSFEIQEVMLHDLTFLFCTSGDSRKVFTDWDEWYMSMLLVYLNAWASGKEGIMNSCINLIQVLAQHAYRGDRFVIFSNQLVFSTLIIKTKLYSEYLNGFGKQDVYRKIDSMTSSVIKQLLSFAIEDLLVGQRQSVSANVELCELNSLILLVLVDRYFSILSLSSLEENKNGLLDLDQVSEIANADWILVEDTLSKAENEEMKPMDFASIILEQVIENTSVLPEKRKVDLLCFYGSNDIVQNLLRKNRKKNPSTKLNDEDLDMEILALAMKNMDTLLQRGNVIKYIHSDKASQHVLLPLTRLVLVSWRLSEPTQRTERNHYAFLEKFLGPFFVDHTEKYQAISLALTIIVYQEAVLSLADESFPLNELTTLLMKVVQKWQTLLQENLLQDSEAIKAARSSKVISSLPAPLLLAQQNILSLNPVAMKKSLEEVLSVQKTTLGSEELSVALGHLLILSEIQQNYIVHQNHICKYFCGAGDDCLAKQTVGPLADILKERKSHSSAQLHHFEVLSQENLQLSHTSLLDNMQELSFDNQSSYDSAARVQLPQGPNRWKIGGVENSCRKRTRLTLCTGVVDYQPASQQSNLQEKKNPVNMENLLPASKEISLFEGEEDDEEEESESGSPKSSYMKSPLTSPGGSQRGREEERNIKFETFALMVTPKGTTLGWIDINNNSFFFSSIDEEDEMAAFEEEGKSLPMSYMRSFLVEESDQKKKTLELNLDSVHLILVRRYCLRRSAIEFFLTDRTSYFFDFGTPDLRQKAYSMLVSMKPKKLHPLCYYSQNPEKLIKKSEITDRWVRREISNFEYLMYLNTFAGRSYNDITQYPVFPWVLSDYRSKEIDLSDASVYRDLSKPVGALHPDRLKKFVERYQSFEDDMMPKFHYGSHYSSSGIVLYYLLRLEPFAGLAVSLQGGKFDHADRLFDDLPGTFEGCLSDMSDVKELIPEFYYCPEMLLNVNDFNLGTRQDGKKLGNVTLPPWASDAAEFISIHQQALESEYVSNNLHLWIDLIFGSKQRGEQAAEACNVFFYMTYEGQVDIDAINDPTQQKAALDQIAHFGQTPYQLFKDAHPSRMPIEQCISPLFTNISAVTMYEVDVGSSERASTGHVRITQDSIVMISSLYPYTVSAMDFKANTPDSSGLPFSGKSKSKAISAISTLSQKLSAVTNLLDTGLNGWSTILDSSLTFKDCFALSENGRHIFSCGYHDYTIRYCDASTKKSVEILRGLEQPTCLALSQCGSILAVGFRNSTIGVWIVESGLKAPNDTWRANIRSSMINMEGFFFNSSSFVEWMSEEKDGGS